MTRDSKDLGNELFLVGKKNCDVIWCTQLEDGIDKYARELASYTLAVKKIKTKKNPIFSITTKRK